jgi:hypothetical protein
MMLLLPLLVIVFFALCVALWINQARQQEGKPGYGHKTRLGISKALSLKSL